VTATAERVDAALAWLERRSSKRVRDDMLSRYGITAPKAWGVPVGTIQQLGKQLGRDHDLALALWPTGWYEARMLCAFVDDPGVVTPAQMDRWAKDFNNWAICDSTTFHLFDKTPHAWDKVRAWAPRKEEFVKRAAFALLAALAVHDKRAPDTPYRRALPLIARAAKDERNFVKKGVSWALRSIGNRSPELNAAAIQLATRLSKSKNATERWVGKDTLRDITRPLVQKRAAKWASRRSS
jgi:3-methyladenine DNA glycosylase AlkD